MKRIALSLLLFALALALAPLAIAQSPVAVTATVTATNAAVYANGTYTIQLVDASGNPLQSANLNGSTYTNTRQSGALDSSGALAVSLYTNSALYDPKGATKWSFLVCSPAPSLALPILLTAQVCFTQAVTITGAGDISGTLSASASPFYYANPVTGTGNIGGGGGTFTALTGDATSTSTGGATTVKGLNGVPFCTGFTPTANQFVQYTTASSPNPCYTAAVANSGTVTSVSVTTANGVSGTVANPTTTPAISLTLGAITPTSTNGVPAATMAFMDATSSVQTQLNAKGAGTVTAVSVASANGVSGTSSGGATPALTIALGAITPSSVASTGAVSGTTVSAGTAPSCTGSSIGCYGNQATANTSAANVCSIQNVANVLETSCNGSTPTPIGAGAGTVTVSGGGNVTSTALVTGAGTQVIQTPSATSTLDSSGNMILAGALSAGTSPPTNTAGTAGSEVFKEGTAFTAVSGTEGIYGNAANHCVDVINQTTDVGCLDAASNTITLSNKTFVTPVLGAATGTSLANTGAVSGASINLCADSSGSGTAQVCTTTPATFTVAAGSCFTYTTTTTNSGAGLTINANALGAKSVAIPGASGFTTTLTASIIPANKPLVVCYDGTNLDVQQTGTSTASGGTVTVVGAGSLTSTAIMTGGGTTTAQTPSATATLSSGGAMVLPGTLSVGTSPPACTAGTAGTTCQGTGTAPTGLASTGEMWPNSADNDYYFNVNNGTTQHLPQTAFITANYTNATTSFTSLTNLAFTVAASTNYHLHCNLVWSASAATAGPKYQITGPASPTAVVIQMSTAVTSSTSASAGVTAFSTALSPTGAVVTTATTEYSTLDMDLLNGTTAGTVQIQAAAQGTGTLTISNGSGCQAQ